MAINPVENAQAVKIQVIDKLQSLLREYAGGKLNHEQFNQQYEYYAQQLESAQHSLDTGEMMRVTPEEIAASFDLPQAYIGDVQGMAIYQNHTGALIEKLGDFEVSVFAISPVLSDFVRMRKTGKSIAPRVEKLENRRWLLFTDLQITTVVTLFPAEPTPSQIREIEHMHQAFETIGRALLEKRQPDAQKTAHPFDAISQHMPRRI